ncbi:MAG: amidohydrolase, partial [Oscillospiraceae bacterium]
KISIQGGNRMSCCDTFTLTVYGTSAHGAMPHSGNDAIVASAAIISALQTIASRRNNPVSPFVLTIGTINGGEQLNIIADKVVMTGTVRSFTTGDHIVKEMEKIINGVAAAYGVKAELQYKFVLIPLINNVGGLVTLAQDSVKKLYGEDGLVETESMMVSEDFAYYMEKVSGVFGFLGTYNKEKGLIYGNHSDKFTADEDILHKGSATLAQFAVDFLGE